MGGEKSNIEPAAIVGHYHMEDVDGGVNSELQLTEDHRFKFGMGYGAALTYTQGSWQVQGDQIELASAPARAEAFENRPISTWLADNSFQTVEFAKSSEPPSPNNAAPISTSTALCLASMAARRRFSENTMATMLNHAQCANDMKKP